jgi:hypothetical protein
VAAKVDLHTIRLGINRTSQHGIVVVLPFGRVGRYMSALRTRSDRMGSEKHQVVIPRVPERLSARAERVGQICASHAHGGESIPRCAWAVPGCVSACPFSTPLIATTPAAPVRRRPTRVSLSAAGPVKLGRPCVI